MRQRYTSDELVHLVGSRHPNDDDANLETLSLLIGSGEVRTKRMESGPGAWGYLTHRKFDPANPRLKRLALTSREREQTGKQLKGVYPAVARKAATLSPVEVAIGILYDFLTSKSWRSHDQRYAGGEGGARN